MQSEVVGAVEYRISATEKDVINARYLSTGSMGQQAGAICRGRAKGDTSGGFPGQYRIQYFGTDDALVGIFDLEIAPVGESFRLTWRNLAENPTLPGGPGVIVFEGFGFPNSETSIVVCYWMTEAVGAALVASR